MSFQKVYTILSSAIYNNAVHKKWQDCSYRPTRFYYFILLSENSLASWHIHNCLTWAYAKHNSLGTNLTMKVYVVVFNWCQIADYFNVWNTLFSQVWHSTDYGIMRTNQTTTKLFYFNKGAKNNRTHFFVFNDFSHFCV